MHSTKFIRCKQLFFSLFLVGLFPVIAQAGSIHGNVRGVNGGVVGATVRLLELNRATSTNATGDYAFGNVPNGSYRVFVRILGYASQFDSVQIMNNDAEASFTLKESAIQAEDIVITASPYARPEDEQYQPSETKSLEELHQSPGTSFTEEISDIPGIAVRSLGSAPSRPIIRGLNDNDALVLENGLRIGDISTYDPAHSLPIEPMSIEQIDVVRGPASIMYGPNAIGGLVNVITNTIPMASNHTFSGTVSTELNSVSDAYTGYFNTTYSDGSSAFNVSAGGLHSGDTHIPMSNYWDGAAIWNMDTIPQSWEHTAEAGAGYSYQGDFGMVGIGYKYFQSTYGIPGTPANPNYSTDLPTTSEIEQEKNSIEIRGLFNVEIPLIKQIKFNANDVWYWHSEYPTTQDPPTPQNPSGIYDSNANHFDLNGINASLQFQHQQFGLLQGTVGLWANIQTLDVEGQMPLGPNSTTTDFAGYIFEEYLASDNTRLQGAIRYDYNHIQTSPYAASLSPIFQTLDTAISSSSFTGSFGVIEKIAPDATASLSIARSFRPPTVQELFANGLDASSASYSIGSSSLAPEYGFGIDGSVRGTAGVVSFELSQYVNFINNFIYGKYTGADSMGFPVRVFTQTNARILGFEAGITVALARYLALKATLDYVNAEQTQDTVQPLPNIPPLRELLRLTYQDEVFSAMGECRLAAAQDQSGVGDIPTSGYAVLNAGVGVRLPQGDMVHNISIHCDNLLNTIYYDNLSNIRYYTPGGNGIYVPQSGRGFRLNYDLTF